MSNRILHWGLLSTAQINRALIKPLRMSLADSRDNIEIILRLFESARTGKLVTL
jgi:hypothetical protein